VILLVYPAFGPNTGKDPKPFNKDTNVYRLLQDEGMAIYKTAITDNNNEELRDKFFLTPIVAKIWKKIAINMTLKEYFDNKEPNLKILPSYFEVTRVMRRRYRLEMSPEWNEAFPEQE
jgi:hypothetical protein